MNLEALLGKVEKARVGIVGDICVDSYVFVSDDRTEISVETGLKTRSVKRFTFDLGGAGNVAINLRRLGVGKVDLYGIIGEDAYGDIVKSILGREGISAEGVVVQTEEWSTHTYCKFYSRGEEEPRLDYGNFNRPRRDLVDRLLAGLESRLGDYDAMVINEQVISGFQDFYFQDKLRGLITRAAGKPLWICDCRRLNDVYKDCVHKLNDREGRAIYLANCEATSQCNLSDTELAQWLFAHWGRAVILTRGDNGAIVCDEAGIREIQGLHVIDQVDAVGAGDAFLAATAACLASGASLEDAAIVGNFAAGVSIQKLFQTGHPSPQEILCIGTSPDYRYNPDIAEDSRRASHIPGTEVEIIAKPASGMPRVAIFDHDGTISTLRQGWETIMTRVMEASILEAAESEVSLTAHRAVEVAVRNLIERTTGVQTLLQMKALCKLVADFGYVRDIKSPAEYKAIYNAQLLGLVEARLDRVRKGALGVEDFTVKGAVPFLSRLRASGVALYLTSGTDAEDVRREAEVLGYADFFEGGIHGSVGDIERDPKRVVLEKILGELGTEAKACLVFGDGPVELREGKKRGATAIGVASDEARRHGMNSAKRPRLILGGADAIIPDFSWGPELVSWLGWELRS
jgi:bifunctional ADP-heptose synthase (sugar kinase/adenylyltransferase)/phosphoglycolate phosphatase-like HAD superfamily hydrolase